MRQDQIQHLMSKTGMPGLNTEVARLMNYNTFDWISKDVDAYFAHVPSRHKMTYEVPEEAYPNGLLAQDLADILTASPAYKAYNDPLEDGQVGRMVIWDYQIFPSEVSTSGWKVVFSYSFIQFDQPYW